MSFDRHFFDELRTLTKPLVEQIDPVNFRPSVTELYNAGIVSHGFLNTLGNLVKGIYKAGYKLSPSFRAYPQHICTFPDGKAFRKQINTWKPILYPRRLWRINLTLPTNGAFWITRLP